MEQLPTRQRILQCALDLFAQKGFDAVSVAEIAAAVGIKAPSLYKHYASKQEIFDAIVAEMATRYEKQAATLHMDGSAPEKDSALFAAMDEEQLVEMGKSLFLYFLQDEYMAGFRRLLTVEQFANERLAQLYTRQYVEAPLAYQGALFGHLVGAGVFPPEDTDCMALHFYAPLYLLLTQCDRHPTGEAAALQALEKHIRQFCRLYKAGAGPEDKGEPQ